MATVTIKGGKRWKNEELKPNEIMTAELKGNRDYTLELGPDDLILNGFVDYHCHVWAPRCGAGLPSDKFLAQGTICAGEAGSFGMNDWDAATLFYDNCVPIDVREYIYLLPEGQTVEPMPDPRPTHPYDVDRDKLVQFIKEKRNEKFLGVKVQLGFYNKSFDLALMEVVRDVCDRADTTFMAHITNTYLTPEELLAFAKKGDVIAHYCQSKQNPFVRPDGTIPQCVLDAHERGVLFDSAQGTKHFTFDVFDKLWDAGIKPIGLATDITIRTFQRQAPFQYFYLFSQFAAVTKLSIEDVLKLATTSPAKHLNFDYENYPGVLVLKKYEGHTFYYDKNGGCRSGFFHYRPAFFANKGIVVIDHDIPDPPQWGFPLV